MNPPAAVAVVNEKTDKEEPGASFVPVQATRKVRVIPITEQEARSVDQQHLMASAALSFGTFFFGMLANVWLAGTAWDWHMAVILIVVAIASWPFGGWLLWTRRSLLETIRRESGLGHGEREV